MRINEQHLPTTFIVASTLATFGGLVGCQRDSMVEIAGDVTIEGKPLEEGTIRFAPRNQQGPSAGTTVQHGKYHLRLLPGTKTVRIEAFKTLGERPADPSMPNARMTPVKQQLLPNNYNVESTLTCDVESKKCQYDFDLKN
jgi:hypothetical protein